MITLNEQQYENFLKSTNQKIRIIGLDVCYKLKIMWIHMGCGEKIKVNFTQIIEQNKNEHLDFNDISIEKDGLSLKIDHFEMITMLIIYRWGCKNANEKGHG